MNANVSPDIKLLIERKIFKTEEEAIRNLLREYILKQITDLQREISRFERRYGMSFERFNDFIHDRSTLLAQNNLSAEQRLNLSQAIMRDEDTILDWKVAREMLDSWLGISREIAA